MVTRQENSLYSSPPQLIPKGPNLRCARHTRDVRKTFMSSSFKKKKSKIYEETVLSLQHVPVQGMTIIILLTRCSSCESSQ